MKSVENLNKWTIDKMLALKAQDDVQQNTVIIYDKACVLLSNGSHLK